MHVAHENQLKHFSNAIVVLMSFYYSYNYVMNAFCRFEIYTLFDWYLIVISRKAFQIREFIFFYSSFLIEIKSRYFAWFRTLINKNQRKQNFT